jgi:outer membrane protein
MKSTFVQFVLAAVVALSPAAFAQAGGSQALPAAPGSPADPPALTNSSGTKIGAINIEQAIFASNEGQRDMEGLQKKFEPKSSELKGKNDEVEQLKKQLNTQGDKMNEDAKANLQRQIEQRQKALDREAQDAREDFQNQQNEIGQRILQKMAPVILKYANQKGLGVILDTSNPWPQGPVVWAEPVDITKAIVEAYNAQSGVPAPAKPSGTTGIRPPAGTGVGAKPAAPATTKPTTPAPPK